MNTNSAAPPHAELRARVAFVGIKYYKLASLIDVHPSRLSQYLHRSVRAQGVDLRVIQASRARLVPADLGQALKRKKAQP
jgi:hypothetical protein